MPALKNTSPDEYIIHTRANPIVIRIILGFFLVVSAIIPLAATAYVLSQGNGFHFSLVFSYVIFWGAGFILLRSIFWNTYGKEVIVLNQQNVEYYADYKYWKDALKCFPRADLQIEIIPESTRHETGRLKLSFENESLTTAVEVDVSELEQLIARIKGRHEE